MNTEQIFLELIRELPTDQQHEILDHARRLGSKNPRMKAPRQNARGLWADFNIVLSAEEIDDSRREMLKNFPREHH